jgi:hypothetical protein
MIEEILDSLLTRNLVSLKELTTLTLGIFVTDLLSSCTLKLTLRLKLVQQAILMILCKKIVNTKHELVGVQFTFILFNYSH